MIVSFLKRLFLKLLKMEQKRQRIKQLRWIGIAEGWSFLLLLGIAMPLKYLYDLPLAVKYTGWAHGILFILYIAAVFRAAYLLSWRLPRIAAALAASVLPFATFILDRRWKAEEQRYMRKNKPE